MPGHLDDAVSEYEETLRLKPDNAEAHSNLGNAWTNMPGHLNDAIAQIETALRLKLGGRTISAEAVRAISAAMMPPTSPWWPRAATKNSGAALSSP